MPTLYWSPWLAKIRRGGPGICLQNFIIVVLLLEGSYWIRLYYFKQHGLDLQYKKCLRVLGGSVILMPLNSLFCLDSVTSVYQSSVSSNSVYDIL